MENDDQVISVLRYYNWNQRNIEEKWFEEMDKLRFVIGLEYDTTLVQQHPDVNASLAENNSGMCGICYCEFDEDDEEMKVDQLCCGHQYNVVCWKYYLKEKVQSEGPGCVFAKCPQLRCNVVVPHSLFLKYLVDGPDPENGINYYDKYMDWHAQQFTNSNVNFKWCPAKNCGRVIEKFEYTLKKSVTCHCGNSFCYNCDKEDHEPAGCALLEKWDEKEKSDSATINWIKANTKPCPGCKKPIEKNQGCMHMTCRNCTH